MKPSRSSSVICCFLLLLFLVPVAAEELPRVVSRHGRHALLVDGQPYLVLGAQMNNSSAWPGLLPSVWPAIEAIHANTLEAPVYWEQIEPKEGQFDFTNVDTLLQQAREHRVRLILLWFGTWKNGAMHYAPDWVRRDGARFPRMIDADGRPLGILSVHTAATLEADRTAFAALMRHLKEADGSQHTVLMVQVENEPGAYGTVRDFGAAAQKAFDGQVPHELVKALGQKPGIWREVFGAEADEVFSAYSAAHYIDQVAAAGRREYPLPMYINAALRDPNDSGAKPGRNYPTGGPSFNVLDIWRATAKSLDMVTPNIYLRDSSYLKTLDLYTRADNPLMVVETSNDPSFAKYFFSVLGHGGFGFSPFGIDFSGYENFPLGAKETSEKSLAPFAANYRLFAPILREIARLNFEGALKTAVEEKGVSRQVLDFGKWQAKVSYGLPQFGPGDNPPGNPDADGRVLVAQLGPDEFLVVGFNARVDLDLSGVPGEKAEYLRVEEDAYSDGQRHLLRLWNGDQTDWGLNFTQRPCVLRVKLATY